MTAPSKVATRLTDDAVAGLYTSGDAASQELLLEHVRRVLGKAAWPYWKRSHPGVLDPTVQPEGWGQFVGYLVAEAWTNWLEEWEQKGRPKPWNLYLRNRVDCFLKAKKDKALRQRKLDAEHSLDIARTVHRDTPLGKANISNLVREVMVAASQAWERDALVTTDGHRLSEDAYTLGMLWLENQDDLRVAVEKFRAQTGRVLFDSKRLIGAFIEAVRPHIPQTLEKWQTWQTWQEETAAPEPQVTKRTKPKLDEAECVAPQMAPADMPKEKKMIHGQEVSVTICPPSRPVEPMSGRKT